MNRNILKIELENYNNVSFDAGYNPVLQIYESDIESLIVEIEERLGREKFVAIIIENYKDEIVSAMEGKWKEAHG